MSTVNYSIKISIAFIVAVALIACKTDHDKTIEANQLAEKRFVELDKTTVDVYPQFQDCDEMDTTANCFYNHLNLLVTNKLAQDTLQLEITQRDSLVTQFTVTHEGQIKYDSIIHCAQHLDRKFLDSLLLDKLTGLPIIDSALKQGVPVTSTYLIPVVIQPIRHSDQ